VTGVSVPIALTVTNPITKPPLALLILPSSLSGSCIRTGYVDLGSISMSMSDNSSTNVALATLGPGTVVPVLGPQPLYYSGALANRVIPGSTHFEAQCPASSGVWTYVWYVRTTGGQTATFSVSVTVRP
jgi:hypothetical protein